MVDAVDIQCTIHRKIDTLFLTGDHKWLAPFLDQPHLLEGMPRREMADTDLQAGEMSIR